MSRRSLKEAPRPLFLAFDDRGRLVSVPLSPNALLFVETLLILPGKDNDDDRSIVR